MHFWDILRGAAADSSASFGVAQAATGKVTRYERK